MTPGIHRLPMADYLADPCDAPSLSSGCGFRLVTQSPLHAWFEHPRLGGHASASSTAADHGSVAHDLLLGGEGKICEIEADDYRTNRAKELRDQARANGLAPILSHQLHSVRQMADVARKFVADSEIAGVFDSGECELTVIAQEVHPVMIDGKEGSETVWLRTRPDWLNEAKGIALHLKTTKRNAHPDTFARLVESMGYGFSLQFYTRALLPNIKRRMRHVILAQEQLPPYACALYALAPAKAELERSRVDRAIGLWRQCMRSDSWPGYSPRIHHLEARPWELAAAEHQLIEDELAAMEEKN